MLTQQRLVWNLNSCALNTRPFPMRMSKDISVPKVVSDDVGDLRSSFRRASTRSPVDRSWHPSQGIKFYSSPDLKSWPVSQNSEDSGCQSVAHLKNSASTPAHPFSMFSEDLSLSTSIKPNFEAKDQGLLNFDFNLRNQINRPVLISATSEKPAESSMRGLMSPSQDGPPQEETALTGPILQTLERKPPVPTGLVKGQCFAENRQDCLRFKIPEAKLKEISLASLENVITYWQYSLYKGPSGEDVKLHYCKSKESSERIAKMFLDQEVLGFDIEWKPQASANEGIRKNVALIQLASEERIAVFHIARFPKYDLESLVLPTLKKIMESSSITKVGVSIKADCTRLRRFLGIQSQGLLELSHLYKLVKYAEGDVKKINKLLVTLACQVEEHLRLPLWKGAVRSSDWTEELNYEQIRYAASDSYAGFHLYHVLENKRKALFPIPPRPAHAELGIPIQLANGETVASYDGSTEDRDDNDPTETSDSTLETKELTAELLDARLEEPTVLNVMPLEKIKRKSVKAAPNALPMEFIAANDWVAQWRKSLPSSYKPRALPTQLRAYALWHEMQQSVINAAAILRDPPLKASTVAAYILEALRLEKLPFEKERVMEVVQDLPESLRGKYKTLLEKNSIERREC